MMPAIGSLVEAKCVQCGDSFTYAFQGKARTLDPKCVKLNAKKSGKERLKRYKLAEGEMEALNAEGLAAIAKCSQTEAAAKLAVWEALEQGLITETSDPDLNPISPQAIQQIERSAIIKLKKALGPFWLEYKASMAAKYTPEEPLYAAGWEVSTRPTSYVRGPKVDDAA